MSQYYQSHHYKRQGSHVHSLRRIVHPAIQQAPQITHQPNSVLRPSQAPVQSSCRNQVPPPYFYQQTVNYSGEPFFQHWVRHNDYGIFGPATQYQQPYSAPFIPNTTTSNAPYQQSFQSPYGCPYPGFTSPFPPTHPYTPWYYPGPSQTSYNLPHPPYPRAYAGPITSTVQTQPINGGRRDGEAKKKKKRKRADQQKSQRSPESQKGKRRKADKVVGSREPAEHNEGTRTVYPSHAHTGKLDIRRWVEQTTTTHLNATAASHLGEGKSHETMKPDNMLATKQPNQEEHQGTRAIDIDGVAKNQDEWTSRYMTRSYTARLAKKTTSANPNPTTERPKTPKDFETRL